MPASLKQLPRKTGKAKSALKSPRIKYARTLTAVRSLFKHLEWPQPMTYHRVGPELLYPRTSSRALLHFAPPMTAVLAGTWLRLKHHYANLGDATIGNS